MNRNFPIKISSNHFADGSVIGYTFDIYDRKLDKTVWESGLYTTLETAMDAALEKVKELEQANDKLK